MRWRMKVKTKIFLVLCALAGTFIYCVMEVNRRFIEPTRIQTSYEHLLRIVSAVDSFKKKNGNLPGDLNKDGLIGQDDFGQYALGRKDPRKDEESNAFWSELKNEGFFDPSNNAYHILPASRSIIVPSHSDGMGDWPKGNVLLWMSRNNMDLSYPYGNETYPLTREQAEYVDRKLDDGNLGKGFVQAYPIYTDMDSNLESDERDKIFCLIYRISE